MPWRGGGAAAAGGSAGAGRGWALGKGGVLVVVSVGGGSAAGRGGRLSEKPRPPGSRSGSRCSRKEGGSRKVGGSPPAHVPKASARLRERASAGGGAARGAKGARAVRGGARGHADLGPWKACWGACWGSCGGSCRHCCRVSPPRGGAACGAAVAAGGECIPCTGGARPGGSERGVAQDSASFVTHAHISRGFCVCGERKRRLQQQMIKAHNFD